MLIESRSDLRRVKALATIRIMAKRIPGLETNMTSEEISLAESWLDNTAIITHEAVKAALLEDPQVQAAYEARQSHNSKK